MALLALGYDMNDTNDEHLEEAKEWLLTLKPNIKAFDSDSPKTFMITKETKTLSLNYHFFLFKALIVPYVANPVPIAAAGIRNFIFLNKLFSKLR